MLGILQLELLPAFLSMLFISVPEEIFLVLFCLILLRRYDVIGLGKNRFFRLFVPIAIPAAVSCVLRDMCPGLESCLPVISIILSAVLIIMVYELYNPASILKVFLCILTSYAVTVLIQLSYVPLLLYETGISGEILTKPGITMFLWSLPGRILEVSLLLWLLAGKRSLIARNCMNTIISTPLLAGVFCLSLALNSVFLILFTKFIENGGIPAGLSDEILVLCIFLLLPLVNLAALFISVYCMERREAFIRYCIQQEFNDSLVDIQLFLEQKNYYGVKEKAICLYENTNALFDEC